MRSSAGGPLSRAQARRFIEELHTSGRPAPAHELAALSAYVAAAGFDPNARETVRGRLAGAVWKGHVLRGSDRLPPEELKYFWHAVFNGEWPVGTTQADYVAS